MAKPGNPSVKFETSHGDISIELFPEDAPVTVKNFLDYIDAGHYDGTIFHRVIPGFMVQGGGMDAEMDEKPTRKPIANEAANGLVNMRGSIAMARTQVIDSATAQFFINAKDNRFLDHRDKSVSGFGYCVFGTVSDGMDVVDKIISVETTSVMGHDDVPVEPVFISKASRI